MAPFELILFIASTAILDSQHIFPNGTRNKYIWPFDSKSIWNHPIGSNAKYVHSGINGSTHFGYDGDYWIVSNTPKEHLQNCTWYRPNSWDNRCVINGKPYPYTIPFPSNIIIPDSIVTSTEKWTPNNAATVLLPDGEHILEMGPICKNNSNALIFGNAVPYGQNIYNNTFQSIYGDGLYGAHFGSGLSSIGGTIRFGELIPGVGPIQHALKWEAWGQKYYYLPQNTANKSDCFRWPAATCDGAFATTYGGIVNATRPGALLAIPPGDVFNKLNDTLKTEPGRMILQALTDYGAYIVSDSAWDQQQFCVEQGVDQEFFDEWGYTMNDPSPFADDMIYISKYLYVVDNNEVDNIGGGGELRQPLPPPIGN